MVFTDLLLSQEFKILGMGNFLWIQALMNHDELEAFRGVDPMDAHQRFLWRILRLGVVNLEEVDKPMDTSTRSMRHSSAIEMRLWKMWREAESWVSVFLSAPSLDRFLHLPPRLITRGHDEGSAEGPGVHRSLLGLSGRGEQATLLSKSSRWSDNHCSFVLAPGGGRCHGDQWEGHGDRPGEAQQVV